MAPSSNPPLSFPAAGTAAMLRTLSSPLQNRLVPALPHRPSWPLGRPFREPPRAAGIAESAARGLAASLHQAKAAGSWITPADLGPFSGVPRSPSPGSHPSPHDAPVSLAATPGEC
jgi:hypothetical protein